jgi:hypothetical protein
VTSDQIVYQQRVRVLDHAQDQTAARDAERDTDRLFDQGFTMGKSTVQHLLIKHGLGCRHQRRSRAAAITALTTGLVTEVAVEDDPFGFCH